MLKTRSDPETVTDTLFKEIVCLFCIHFGLPGPPLDAPAALKTRPKRLKSAPRCYWRRFQSSIWVSRALQILSDGVRNHLGASRALPDALGDASRAPILASRALQVLPDGLRKHHKLSQTSKHLPKDLPWCTANLRYFFPT